MERDILILGIESSCDETAAAVVQNGREMLSNVIDSQIEIHKRFGGVVPEIASRNHTMAIETVVDKALKDAGVTLQDVTAIAVTYGAGLVGALLVGVSYAKALSYACEKPLIAVNHIHGHIAANYIAHPSLTPPYLCLVTSGGHTALIRVTDYTRHTLVGTTVDDAVGEAFDKVARVLGLPYPGGANVDRLAKEGRETIPLPHRKAENFRFSYSGLKTATINAVHNMRQRGEEPNVADVCCSFQHAAIDVLVDAAALAARKYGERSIALAGGVAANSYLRESVRQMAAREGLTAYFPPPVLCTDNAAMIAAAGYFRYRAGEGAAGLDLNAVPNLEL